MSNDEITIMLNENGGNTFTTKEIIPAFVTDGVSHATNSYYGNSQVFRPTYKARTIPIGTVMLACPGGIWFVIDGRLAGFSLDKRDPNNVGSFEKHYDPTRSVLCHLLKTGGIKHDGKGLPESFHPMYQEYIKAK